MKKAGIAALLAALLLLLTGCRMHTQYKIVATTAPVQQLAQAVCEGTGLEVGLVISDAVSCLHDYTLSVRQMETVERAELVILSGAGLEDFMEDVLQASQDTIECADGVALLPGEDGEADPHIWLDPDNAAIMARNIAHGLSARYPAEAETFAANAEAVCARLAALQDDCTALLADLPTRGIITFHDGFSYFAQAFDLDILAAIEEESGSEASAKELKEMTELVRDAGVPAVFVEKDGSRAAASVIAGETGCRIGTLDMLLSGSDYFEGLRANAEAIREAMQ